MLTHTHTHTHTLHTPKFYSSHGVGQSQGLGSTPPSMSSWSQRVHTREGDTAAGPGSRAGRGPVGVWVSHPPAQPDDRSDVLVDDPASSSSGSTAVSTAADTGKPETEENVDVNMKDRLKSLLPKNMGRTLRGWTRGRWGSSPEEGAVPPDGTRVSPPMSPLTARRRWGEEAEEEGGGGGGSLATSSQRSDKPLLADRFLYGGEESVLTSLHPAECYAEKVELYKLKYSYLKSWPGLLRLLGGMELLFGGMVVACVVAYVQRDSEWDASYGMTNGVFNNGAGPAGYSYGGPMTPFVLAVAGVSWVVTLVLLVLGLTLYYRAILLDSAWWPLTEALVNVALFLLYMAGGVVYVNDLNRGGLCHMALGVNPLVASLCRVDGGQMAGTTFLFIVMLMYLVGFMVALKMWRHEATRREMEGFRPEEEHQQTIPLSKKKPKKISFKDDEGYARKKPLTQKLQPTKDYNAQNYSTHIVPDYVTKYPEIASAEELERYKAVFNDQYPQYKDLHREISHTLQKFQELDDMVAELLRNHNTPQEHERIERMLHTFEGKKNDPGFLEKRERYMYMKNKLSHIKNRIQTFDTMSNSGLTSRLLKEKGPLSFY